MNCKFIVFFIRENVFHKDHSLHLFQYKNGKAGNWLKLNSTYVLTMIKAQPNYLFTKGLISVHGQPPNVPRCSLYSNGNFHRREKNCHLSYPDLVDFSDNQEIL